MRTKVSVFCDQAIEAGWLLALVTVPLFFNLYASRAFEANKVSLLRSVATMMAAACLIKWSEQGLWPRSENEKGEALEPLKRFLSIPLVRPVLLLALVQIVATMTSVVPRVSLWGSYHLLQGTCTALSYLVIFFLLLQNLRRREQLGRLLTTIILTSLPIALYGLLQHYQLDPLPLGTWTYFRVSSSMGNAIFLGAYLVMIVPLTLGRVVQMQATALEKANSRLRVGFGLAFWLALLVQIYAWSVLGFEAGLAAGLTLIAVLAVAAVRLKRPVARFILLGCYALILSVQLVCIFFSKSRGPLVGLITGLAFLSFVYIVSRRWRALSLVFAALVLAAVALLGMIILPKSPLPAVQNMLYTSHFGRIFDLGGPTGKSRILVWEGAVDMLAADPLRTLIGYGPEAMHIAYRPFYPPELARYEERSASPARSHNETFDALITTGAVGFLAYAFLIGCIFYYGLSWLGLIRGRSQTRLFFACGTAGCLMGILAPLVIDGSFRFAGVGLPLGFVVGLAVYVGASALFGMFGKSRSDPVASGLSGWDLLLLASLMSSIVAHFIEIQFGIAIAATRTCFWAYVASMVVLGRRLLSAEGAGAPGWSEERIAPGESSTASVGQARPATRAGSTLVRLVPPASLVGLVLVTLAWDYVTNPLGLRDPFAIVAKSLTTMSARGMPEVTSLGMVWMVLAVWIISTLAIVSESVQHEGKARHGRWWLRSLGLSALVSGGISGVFALIHAARLAPGVEVPNLIYGYYAVLFLVGSVFALISYFRLSRPVVRTRGPVLVVYPLLLLGGLFLVYKSNVSTIRADTLHRLGIAFDQEGTRGGAIYYYQQAVQLAPKEDLYYLFLGRSLIERGKLEADPQLRDAYFGAALSSLEEARRLSPLDSDHLADMGRLYRIWAELADDPDGRRAKLQRALDLYAQAARLSPRSARLLDAWGLVYYVAGDPDRALAKYEEALLLDKRFAQTHLLMGDAHLSRAEWSDAVRTYKRAIALDQKVGKEVRVWGGLAYAYSQLGETNEAVAANLRVLELLPNDCGTLKNLSILYQESGQPAEALSYAERALAVVPEREKAMLQEIIRQLQDQSEGEES